LDEPVIAEGILLLFLLLLSGLFSASETALTSLSKFKIKHLQQIMPARAKILSQWLEDPHKILTTILVGNNLVNISASTLAASISMRIARVRGFTDARAMGISIGVMTFIILIFGEIVPKIYARQKPEKLAFFSLRIMRILSLVFYPLVKLLTLIAKGVIRALGGKMVDITSQFLTDQEIRSLIIAAEKEQLIEEEEREMIEGVFEIGEKRVSEIMVPRINISALDIETPLVRAIEEIKKWGFSRIPVYRKNIDNIVGILYSRDLLNCIGGGKIENMSLESLIHKPMFIPETKKLDELLRDFKRRKTHVAIVVDEYGGTAGLVTLEDVLEEIVGEIEDEYDREGRMWEQISPHVYVVDARLGIEEAEEELNISLPQNDFETVGGFIMEQLQKVPQKGEMVEWGDIKMLVLDADERRVKKIKIIKMEEKDEETER